MALSDFPTIPSTFMFKDKDALEAWIAAIRQTNNYKTNPEYSAAIEARYKEASAAFGSTDNDLPLQPGPSVVPSIPPANTGGALPPQAGPPVPTLPPVNAFKDTATLERWISTVRQGDSYKTNPDYRKAVDALYSQVLAGFAPPPPTPLPPTKPGTGGRFGGAVAAAAGAFGKDSVQSILHQQFEQFLAKEPFGHLNSFISDITESRGAPLRALFNLTNANNSTTGAVGGKPALSFSDFLKGEPEEQFFNPVGDRLRGLLLGVKHNLYDKLPTATGPEANIIRTKQSELESIATELISQFYRENVHPIFQPFVRDVIMRRINAALADNPDVDLLKKFIEQEFNI